MCGEHSDLVAEIADMEDLTGSKFINIKNISVASCSCDFDGVKNATGSYNTISTNSESLTWHKMVWKFIVKIWSEES